MRSVTHHLMKDGTSFEIHPCIDPDVSFTRERLKEELQEAIKELSIESRWQRFFSPIHALTDEQLDTLTDLDGKSRVAWCAVIREEDQYKGVGISRYVRFTDKPEVAEFAVTVVDEYHGKGIGQALLKALISSAARNNIRTLRGTILPSNKGMLALCKHFGAVLHREERVIQADIPVIE